ncbi:MAG: amino acid permease [Acidobacteriaceae bacterium]|nr:amino acid permease [Acidobacteriaceae bacterium]
MGIWGALSANILNMIGVGPFLTIPLAVAAMGGPQAMIGWILGAVLCMCDGMVWAELGSRFPQSGGPYHYLLYGFGPKSWGRLFSYLYLWQSLLIGPISIAGGAVGFSEYARFIVPGMQHRHQVMLAMGVCALATVLLYRSIRSIAALSLVVTVAVIGTCTWIIVSGALHFHASLAFDLPPNAFHMSRAFWAGLGSATLIGVYDYGGYNNVCLLGDEIQTPNRTIPKAVLFSIAIVALLYLAMNASILGTVPWRQAQHSNAVVADFMQILYGHVGGVVVSLLILVAAFGSVYAILLGFSRVPYTAAVDGHFFSIFAKLHPTGNFPTTSLLVMGGLSALACLFSLADLISVLIVVQTMFQFIAQCIALMLLRRDGTTSNDVYRMPFYPMPAVVALLGWVYILVSGKPQHLLIGIAMAAVGAGFYLLQAKRRKEWPFNAYETI